MKISKIVIKKGMSGVYIIVYILYRPVMFSHANIAVATITKIVNIILKCQLIILFIPLFMFTRHYCTSGWKFNYQMKNYLIMPADTFRMFLNI